MKRPNYIADGYACPAFVKGVELMFGDFRFSYKPVLTDERAAFVGSLDGLKPDQSERRAMELVVSKITKWNLKLPNGDAAPLTLNSMRRLAYPLWRRVYDIVLGHTASDFDPEWPDDVVESQDANSADDIGKNS